MSTTTPLAAPVVRRAKWGTTVAFVASGFAFASWASRIPSTRDQLGLTTGEVGLVLLALASGSVLALPLAGAVIARLGSERVVRLGSLLLVVAMAGIAAGVTVGVPAVVVALFVLGLAYGGWDVAMNVEGAVVEAHLARTVMPRFHAGFSVGTVGGALLGALLVELDVSVTAHLAGVALLVLLVVPLSVRSFVADDSGPTTTAEVTADDGTDAPAPGALAAWREPRTLLVGVFVLAFAFAEGTANDWVALAMVEGYGAAESLGVLTFAVFLAAMTVGRWYGSVWLDRWGRVPVVRVLAGVALVGLVLFVAAPSVPLAVVGAVLWGLGTSLGFPLGMSAAADDPARAPARVSVVASVGYVAFLAGPPLIGLLGEAAGLLRALLVVVALLAVALLVSGAVRPLGAPARRAG
ncbi:MFS transporter [Pseudokineococcus lusitanus]|uniref:Fucose permease n=1 Tax=Pseudokineococcus lusitanus TaxID=763993 RepID=A0A3N1HQY6_9ACTN|nr:MFS transporter [Pseudokineococcus lusitanus]ROP44859.1 fucose permease [Pseudokineococcus lusitanus]